MVIKKNNKKELKELTFLFLRYLLLLIIVFSLPLIYKLLTPLTIKATGFLLRFFYEIYISQNNIIIFPGKVIQIIPACVAGSAYVLLLILNLTTSIKLKTRVYSILFSVFSLFAFNVIRIFLLTVLLMQNSIFFDLSHKFFWYFLSTIFVIGIWFISVFIFKIRKIPVYSDLKFLLTKIKNPSG